MNRHTYFEKIGLLQHSHRPAWKGYITGFVLSVLVTLFAFALVTYHLLVPQDTLVVLVVLALVQFFVQAFSFLHLGWGVDSRERSVVLIFATIIVAILVSGSVWIMASLNERMMPSTVQMEQYMGNQPGL